MMRFLTNHFLLRLKRRAMIIRTYLDYPIEVVARKLKVRPNTISKARRKIARELRKKLV